jgi:hypothetical protein
MAAHASGARLPREQWDQAAADAKAQAQGLRRAPVRLTDAELYMLRRQAEAMAAGTGPGRDQAVTTLLLQLTNAYLRDKQRLQDQQDRAEAQRRTEQSRKPPQEARQ